jgi:hypothetical protein
MNSDGVPYLHMPNGNCCFSPPKKMKSLNPKSHAGLLKIARMTVKNNVRRGNFRPGPYAGSSMEPFAAARTRIAGPKKLKSAKNARHFPPD